MFATSTKTVLTAILLSTAISMLSACSGEPLSTREKGTLAGGALGAGTGAIVGSAVGTPGAGAAIGGALGAGTGFVVGNELQNQEVRQSHIQSQASTEQREIESQRRQIQELKQQQETE
jgi:osmotically inducible lipoprotein OsmB